MPDNEQFREANLSHSARDVELRYQHDEFDASCSWSARERVSLRGMEDYLRKSEDALVDELETLLLVPSDVPGVITALAENACDGDGSRRVELIDKAKTRWSGCGMKCHQAQEDARAKTEKHEELLATIEYLKTQHKGLMTTMERQSRMMKEVSQETQNTFLKEVFVLKETLADVEGELFEVRS